MHSSFLTTVALCLALITTTLASPNLDAPMTGGATLTKRQTTTTSSSSTDPACLDYSITATQAIIGTNTTYRAVYLAHSNIGTLYDFRMFDAAAAKLPSLTANATLNTQCGNLTALKFTEAESNFTQGIVGPFTAVKPTTITSGPIVAVVVAASIAVFGVTWVFMP